MGKPTGFREYGRETPAARPIDIRLLDWKEVQDPASFPAAKQRTQAARCMDCGVPFCHHGCPLGNIIPEFNDLVFRDRWRNAFEMLSKTNNFPEFTGRICPAPCEEACVLGINEKPVTIKLIEESIIEHAFKEGWVKPQPPRMRTGKKVAIVGSGPAGLAAAAQLNRAGHSVTVFEREDRIGGLLTYGIPGFKLEKHVVRRRLEIMEAEGIEFVVNANVGVNMRMEDLRRGYDAILLACGAAQPRDLPVAGRDLAGIHFAMEYLPQQNRKNLGDEVPAQITAAGKNVVIIGGGDTGADCLGTALRQGARQVTQLELLPRPPEKRTVDMPWPYWPMILRTGSAHQEGGKRQWSVATKSFSGKSGQVRKLHGIRLEWSSGDDGRLHMKELPGSDFEIDCDLCLLAMGFLHPEQHGPIEQLRLEVDARKNVATDEKYECSVPGIFAAGDMRRGQSLVVWAVAEGRNAARSIDAFLMGRSDL